MILAIEDKSGSDLVEKIEFYKYNYELGKFELYPTSEIKFGNKIVRNVIANDINKDNIIDLIITVADTAEQLSKNKIHVYAGSKKDNFIQFDEIDNFETESGILLLDINGDNMKRILYHEKATSQTEEKRLLLSYPNNKK